MQVNQGPNYGITPETRPEVDYAGGARSARLTGRQGSSAQHPIQLADEYGYEQGEFEQKPKIVKDFAKAYMQMVEDMAGKAAAGDEESQLLVTEEEMKELAR
jgi:hypothetical protein